MELKVCIWAFALIALSVVQFSNANYEIENLDDLNEIEYVFSETIKNFAIDPNLIDTVKFVASHLFDNRTLRVEQPNDSKIKELNKIFLDIRRTLNYYRNYDQVNGTIGELSQLYLQSLNKSQDLFSESLDWKLTMSVYRFKKEKWNQSSHRVRDLLSNRHRQLFNSPSIAAQEENWLHSLAKEGANKCETCPSRAEKLKSFYSSHYVVDEIEGFFTIVANNHAICFVTGESCEAPEDVKAAALSRISQYLGRIPRCSCKINPWSFKMLTPQKALIATYLIPDSQTIEYFVRSDSDAFLYLRRSTPYMFPLFKIAIEGQDRLIYARKMIFHNNTRTITLPKYVPNILSGAEFHGFWISRAEKTIKVGKAGDPTPLIAFEDEDLADLKYFDIVDIGEGEWIIKDILPIRSGVRVHLPREDIYWCTPDNRAHTLLGAIQHDPYIPDSYITMKLFESGNSHSQKDEILTGCGVQWVKAQGKIPHEALLANVNHEGQPIFVCRGYYNNHLMVGQLIKQCIVHDSEDHVLTDYDILIQPQIITS